MSQTNTLPPDAKSRFSPHTRNILKLLRRPGRVYLLARDHGMIRVTKTEARLQVRSAGDHLTAEYISGELVLAIRS